MDPNTELPPNQSALRRLPEVTAEDSLASALESLPRIVRACHARMGRPLGREDLEEAIQETGMAAWRRRESYRGESGIETWLYGIARYTILNQLDQRRRTRRRESSGLETSPDPLDEGRSPASLADTALGRIVRQNLEDAGKTAAMILRSHDVEGMSFVQISADLQMKEATVKSRYYRALPALKSRLESLWRDASA